jgi:hypothetical protein
MLQKPEVGLVDELHGLGRQLAVLKRLYQSYELIMTRILQRQRLLHEESHQRRPRLPTVSSDDDLDGLQLSFPHIGFTTSHLHSEHGGVRLSSAAASRFERLVDRIKLYCLSEIDSCLTEKESLTFLVRRIRFPIYRG